MSFVQFGDMFVAGEPTGKPIDQLPPSVLNLKMHPMKGFFLERGESFLLPEKIYGNQEHLADRIISTAMKRTRNTGVLLSGEKGSGKTLLTMMIALKMQKLGHPTILVNESYGGVDLNQFVERIKQPAVMLFDEFEKVYREEEQQETLLTLLDGTVQSKKLFLLTANKYNSLSSYLKNRPGRLRYTIDFKTLENDVIEDYISQNLENKDHTENLRQVLALFDMLNFDMLQAIVEEMNLHDETATQACKYLNTRPDMDYSERFKAELFRSNGEPIEIKIALMWARPFSNDNIRIDIKKPNLKPKGKKSEDDEDEDEEQFRWDLEDAFIDTSSTLFFNVENLKTADAKGGRYVYAKDKYRLVLTKEEVKEFDWNNRERYLTV